MRAGKTSSFIPVTFRVPTISRKVSGIDHDVFPALVVTHRCHHRVSATQDQKASLRRDQDAHVRRDFERVLAGSCAAGDAFFNEEERGQFAQASEGNGRVVVEER